MRLITVEEHFVNEEINQHYTSVFPGTTSAEKMFSDRNVRLAGEGILTDLVEKRLEAMDRAGVTAQIIGYGDNSPMQFRREDGAVYYCKLANDYLHESIQNAPGRLYGYATLPVDDPESAVMELERCVKELGFKGWMINGPFQDCYLDHQRFFGIFEKASELNVPIYIHPREMKGNILERYYKGSWSELAMINFADYGIGWHYDTGMHLMRLILSGLFDQLSNLNVIVGHWGEMLPYYLERMNMLLTPDVTGLQHEIRYYFNHNIYTNPSGMYFKDNFDFCLKVMGADRLLWGQDYPYAPHTENAATFLHDFGLEDQDREKIAHLNAERIFHLS